MNQPDPQSNPAIPNASEGFRTVPKASEGFGNVPKAAESFRTLRNLAERNDSHTLTVREVARMFEAAGVARTERSIVNWCHPNRNGIARLDAYYEPNERCYYIAPQSVELAIAEEKAKAAKVNQTTETGGSVPKGNEGFRTVPKEPSGTAPADTADGGENPSRIRALEQEVMDLKITNRAKDYFIEQLKQDREAVAAERQTFVEKLIVFTRKVGELETKLLQLTGPRQSEAEAASAADGEVNQTNDSPVTAMN